MIAKKIQKGRWAGRAGILKCTLKETWSQPVCQQGFPSVPWIQPVYHQGFPSNMP